MQFNQPLLEGTLLRRYNRFLADVKLNSGEEITAHCANTGSLLGCSEPGSKVLLSLISNPKRKFRHQVEIIYAGKIPVGVHNGRPSTLVAEALAQGKLAELAGYATLRRDAAYGRKGHRIDLLLEGNGLRSCYIRTKAVTHAHNGTAYFPDGPAHDELEDLTVLTDIVREGCRSLLFFVVNRADGEIFKPGDHLDGTYTEAFRDAHARGVEILCYRAKVSKQIMELDTRLPVDLKD